MFTKYKKKPLVVNAVQWTGSIIMARELKAECPELDFAENENFMIIKHADGVSKVKAHDWLIRGSDGTLSVCSPENFEDSYIKFVDTKK